MDSWKQVSVICDTLSLGKNKYSFGSIRRGNKVAFDFYNDLYSSGPGVGPGKTFSKKSLKSLNFQPALLQADASYHDLLQIADVVVGATNNWISNIKNQKKDPWVVDQIKKIRKNFRQKFGSPDVFGDGITIWPMDPSLWTDLKNSV